MHQCWVEQQSEMHFMVAKYRCKVRLNVIRLREHMYYIQKLSCPYRSPSSSIANTISYRPMCAAASMENLSQYGVGWQSEDDGERNGRYVYVPVRCALLRCAVLCCVVLCYAVLCCVVSCCVVLCCDVM